MRTLTLCLIVACLTGPLGCSWFGAKKSKADPNSQPNPSQGSGPALPPVSQLPKVDDLNRENANSSATALYQQLNSDYQQLNSEKTDSLNQKDSAAATHGAQH